MERLADGTPVYAPTIVVPCDICSVCGRVCQCSTVPCGTRKVRACDKCVNTLDAKQEG